jgi:hypothetical protein
MKRALLTTAAGLFLVAFGALPTKAAIRGDYVEVRSADVYTGPCFANSEVGLAGRQAILAWKVDQGSWQGTSLDGLSVVAVVNANATLGDPYHNPYPASAVLIVDQQATTAQRLALEEFARAVGGKLLEHVVRIDVASIHMAVGRGSEHGRIELVAGKLARVSTRSLCAGDHLCGNEVVYYPPLTQVAHAMPAYTLEDSFGGQGLGVVWDRMGARSAFIGTFAQ